MRDKALYWPVFFEAEACMCSFCFKPPEDAPFYFQTIDDLMHMDIFWSFR